MLAKKSVDKGPNLFYSALSVMLNQKHPLFILAHQINWPVFEEAFAPLILSGQRQAGKTHYS